MSYTFLPQTEHQKMKREYRIRMFIVLSFFVAIAIVIGVGSLFPAFIYATLEEKLHIDQVTMLKKSVDAVQVASVQKQLAASTALMSSLTDAIQSKTFSSTIADIASVKGAVVIHSFSIDNSSPTSVVSTISGIAPTRDDLLSFKERLQSLWPNTEVDLPLSILAQDANVPFSIQIIQTLP